MNNHTLQNTKGEPIDLETIQIATASHRSCPSSPAAATWHGKTQGFVPRLPPQHKAHATFMQPLQCVLQPRLPKHHVTAKRRNSQEPALTLRTTRQPSPHPPHTQGTLHRCLQPLDTEKYKVSCSSFLPKTKPMQHSCSHYNAFCSITWQTRMYLLQPQLSHHHSSGKSHQM